MGFKLVICPPADDTELPDKLREAVPDIEVHLCQSVGEAMEVIEGADAAIGNIVPDLFARADKLRWIGGTMSSPPAGYYHKALIESDVVVTNMSGIYNDYISAHIMAFVLAFAKGFQVHIPRQTRGQWRGPQEHETVYLPGATAVIVGVGGIGSETARLCSAFGITVIGVDPRTRSAPPGVAELRRPEELHAVLPLADFVIVTVPESPETIGMFGLPQFRLMRKEGFLINIGRGTTVILDDVVTALTTGEIAGVGLDVYQIEPLPAEHPLWTTPGALLTPHVAVGNGTLLPQRRREVLVDNAKRFNEGRPLRNVVEKARWF